VFRSDCNLISLIDTSIGADLELAASLGSIGNTLGVNGGCGWVSAIGLVDLKSNDNVCNDDFSFDNTSGLVEDVVWGQDVSVDFGLDIDGSSRSKNVVNDGRSNAWNVVSSKYNWSISSDVDDPFGLEVAVVQNVVCSLGQKRCIDGDVISVSVVGIASEHDGAP